MKRILLACALLAGPAAFAAESSDAAFYREAASGGIAEVEAGKVAQSKGGSEAVRNFGAQMVADHGAANAKLKTAAANSSVKLPTDTDAAHKAMKKKLEGLKGAEFDAAYVQGQVMDHQKTIALLEKQIASGSDPSAKSWAEESLPVVKMHLSMLQGMGQHSASSH